MNQDNHKELTSLSITAFHNMGFLFREGEWDMERCAKALATELEPLIREREDKARLDELEKFPPTDYEGRDYLGGFNDARRQLQERIQELKEVTKHD